MPRVTATVLFTDLVGSTELRGRLGEDAADELRRRHDQLLTEAVERHGGQVIKGLGDGIMATFAGTSDAVAAAVVIQQAIDRVNRSGKVSEPLAVRVGLSSGDVVYEGDDVHGSPVIEASRLCAAAGGGEILAAEMVRWLARSDARQRFAGVGSLELKGLADPLPAVRVEWEPATAASIPLPALLTEIGQIFVGRDAELERLDQLWKEAVAGERRVALLAGEPGVGKTRLAAELTNRVHEDGHTVLAGRCDEDLGVPYQPFVEALRHFVDHTPAAELRERLGRYGGELVRLLPELAEAVPDLPLPLQSDPETERYRLFDAVVAWLSPTSADRPVVLLVDDLHWAAKPTLLLLRHILRSSEPLRLLILGTYRDTELGRRHPLSELLADLRRMTGVERLALSGLDAAAVTAFVEQTAGHGLEPEEEPFAQAIYAETEGNPFFVGEVLRHLAETGAVERRQGRWVATAEIEELGIPEGIRDVVGRRLSRLSDEGNDVLALAAVVGVEFELSVLRRAGGFGEDVVAAAIDEAMAARLVSEVQGASTHYRFAHALVRATLYDELTAARKVAFHRRVAEAIESVHSVLLEQHLPALAYHYAQAAVPAIEPHKAVDYARRAGDAAIAQLAHDEAVRYYRQALELLRLSEAPVPDSIRTGLLIALGEAERRAGDPAFRETLFAAARRAVEQQDHDALVRAALANGRDSLVSAAGRLDAERLEILQAALGAVGEEDSSARARLIARIALEQNWTGDRQELARWCDQAKAMARRVGDRAAVADVLLCSYYLLHSPPTMTQLLEDTSELLALADELGDPRLTLQAFWHRSRAALELGDIAEVERCVEQQERLAAELGEATFRWMALLGGAGLPAIRGRLQESEDRNLAALALGRALQPDAAVFFLAHIFVILREQDRFGEILPTVLEHVADPEFTVPGASALAAFILCELGRPEEGRAHYEPLAATRFSRLRLDNTWMASMACCAEVAVRLGDSTSAAIISELLAPYADRVVTLSASGLNYVSHYLGVLAAALG
ncbi:MAG TPA: AAA family ATPase, partial [Acidimicrobiia bacterium]|nr:AAA family ATPase [Acidimicrobiia bacterium]